jgi:hypothetical protein
MNATALSRSLLFVPRDIEQQNAIWGANCGPSALAALMGLSVADVRPFVEHAHGGVFSGYMHAGHLMTVLESAGYSPHRRNNRIVGAVLWPAQMGLAVLQLDGRWLREGVPFPVRFKYTHTVASAEGGALIFDANAREWLPFVTWNRQVMSDEVGRQKGATGWHTSTVIDV